jgi:chaperonin GroEL (HSP60 family)
MGGIVLTNDGNAILREVNTTNLNITMCVYRSTWLTQQPRV